MKIKTFDCVEMKHNGAQRILDELKGKSKEELVAYWHGKTEQMKARIERDKKAARKTVKTH